MTHITYTYEIASVDEAHKAMTILYTSPEYGTVLVGAPMPMEGETLDGIAEMYSPVATWLTKDRAVLPVAVGAKGSLEYAPAPAEPPARTSLDKRALAGKLRDTLHGDSTLWDAFKAALATADEQTQEDWDMTVVVNRNDQILVAILTTLLGAADAATTIDTLYA